MSKQFADTIEEALQHIERRLSEGQPLEQSTGLFTDAVQGFTETRTVVDENFPKAAGDGQLIAATEAVQVALGRMTDSFEGVAVEGALTILRGTLSPRFDTWRKELRRLLLPHVVSSSRILKPRSWDTM